MNNDLRQQILVSLRAEGLGDVDRARETAAKLKEEILSLTKAFGEGSIEAPEFKKQVTSLGGQLKFFQEIVDDAEGSLVKLDVGLHKLQASAIKFGDGLRDKNEKNAKSTEDSAARQDAANVKMMKGIIAAEQAVEEASDAINAALAEENAAFQRHAQVVIEAETEIERLQHRATVAIADRMATGDANRAANAKAAKLQANEQKHWNDVLNEGVVMQNSATRSTVEFATATNKGSEKADQFGYAILHVAHAFQDLQYGLAAAINNIPLIVTAFGGSAAFAGGAMGAAVALQILAPKLVEVGEAAKKMVRDFDGVVDPASAVADSIADLNAKLDALEKNPHKVALDYVKIEQAQEKLADLERRLAAFNSHVNDATPLQEKVAKEVGAVVAEFSGGTDEKSGTQNLLEIIEAARKKRGDQTFGGEMFTTQADHATHKRLIENRALMIQNQTPEEMNKVDRFLFDQVNEKIAALEHKMKNSGQEKIKALIGGALTGNDKSIADLFEEFAKDPATFLAPGGRMTGVDPEFPNMLQQARGTQIQAREAEDAAEKRAESAKQTDDFLKGLRRERAKKAEKVANQSRNSIAQFEDVSLGDEALKDQQAAKAKQETAKEKAARERATVVGQHANRYDGEFARQQGPGSLTDAIVGRVAAGQTNSDIVRGMSGQVKGAIGDVPADLADEVAAKILEDAAGKVRAQAAALGGPGAMAAQRKEQLQRAQDLAAGRQGRQQAGDQEQMLGQQIFGMTGGQLGEQGSMEAAHRAMNSMRDGVQGQAAIFEAIQNTFMKIAAMQEQGNIAQQQFLGQLNGFQQRFNGLQAQQRNGRAQLPGLLQFFPQ